MDEDLVALLDLLPEHEEKALAHPPYRTPEFCSRFLQRVDEIRLFDPRKAAAPARFGVRLAAKLPDAIFGKAWATWASVQRSLARYDRAEFGHKMASLYLDEPVDLARFYRRRAYLLADQGKFDAARKEVGRSLTIYLASGDNHSRGCALVDLGVISFAEKNYGEGVLRISEALRYLDPRHDSRYHEAAVHNLAVGLAHCEQPGARLEVLLREIRQQRYAPGSLPWAKHRWLEGLVLQRRGRHHRAELTLRAARNQLANLGADHDAGLVTMDMAELYLATGQSEKAARLARDMFPVFRSLGVEREAVAAYRLFMQAAAAHTLTQAEIRGVRKTLRELSGARSIRP